MNQLNNSEYTYFNGGFIITTLLAASAYYLYTKSKPNDSVEFGEGEFGGGGAGGQW